MVAVVLYQRWLIRFADPEPELRSKIVRLGWLSGWLGVRELFDHAVLRGGGIPD